MNWRYYSLVAGAFLALGSCRQADEPIATPTGEALSVNLLGSWEQPEWVDLDAERGEARNLVLRRDGADAYPKIRFTALDDGSKSFEPFVSCVWLQPQDHQVSDQDRLMTVEDNGDPNIRNTKTQAGQYQDDASKGTTKGISRVIKTYDGRYRFLIGYTDHNNRNNADKWRPTQSYRAGQRYRFVAAINPPRSSTYRHRAYYPAETVDHNNMPPLKLVDGDYLVGETSDSRHTADKYLSLPLFSTYGVETATLDNLSAGVETKFRLAGALVALQLDNRTGEEIIVRKIRTKSNDLVYSGYYEFWHSHELAPTGANDMFGSAQAGGVPVFARGHNRSDYDRAVDRVYTYPLQTAAGQAGLTMAQGKSLNGRFYLWGGIDLVTSSGFKTLVQVEYSYASEPQRTIYAETVDITPRGKRFANNTAYLVTVPIQRPTLGNLELRMPEHIGNRDYMSEDFPEQP